MDAGFCENPGGKLGEGLRQVGGLWVIFTQKKTRRSGFSILGTYPKWQRYFSRAYFDGAPEPQGLRTATASARRYALDHHGCGLLRLFHRRQGRSRPYSMISNPHA